MCSSRWRRGRAASPAALRPDRSRSGSPAPAPARAAPGARAHPAVARLSSRPGTSRPPPRWPGQAAGERRSSGWLSADRRSRRTDGVGQRCYSSSWRIAPSGGSGRLPPTSIRRLLRRHHPVSPIAPASAILIISSDLSLLMHMCDVTVVIQIPLGLWASHNASDLK